MFYDLQFNNYNNINNSSNMKKNLVIMEDCSVFLAMLTLHNEIFCTYKNSSKAIACISLALCFLQNTTKLSDNENLFWQQWVY